MCYLPTWPIGFPDFFPRGHLQQLPDAERPQERLTSFEVRKMIMGRLVEEAWNSIKPGPDEWIRPQPKCIRWADTYEF